MIQAKRQERKNQISHSTIATSYLTYVHLSPEGDRWFPVFNPAEWEETEHARCDDMQTIPHTFVTLHRKHQ